MFNGHMTNNNSASSALRKRKDSMLTGGYGFVDPNYLPKTLRGLVLNNGLGHRDSIDEESLPQILGERKPTPQCLEEMLPGVKLDREHFSTVLVLYTGGTIGMKSVNGVLQPVPNYMESVLRRMPMFHDKEYAIEMGLTEKGNEPLVMPESKEGKRVLYSILEYDPILDSCNMTMTDWARLAKDIKKYYDLYDAFVIIHGTDTMAYTASALSFIFEDLGKSVIITGSQIPLFEARSDGRDNLMGALTMAGHYVIPEVTLFFNNKLMRGNRTIKKDCGAFDAFSSPNLPPLAELEVDIHVNWSAVFRPSGLERMAIHTNLCPHVALLRFFPSITVQTVKQFIQPPMQGVVLQTYGAGNGPDSNKELLNVFTQAANRGLLIINITQCIRGTVKASYAVGKALQDAGIIPGADMTTEAALAKLAYVLGRDDWNLEYKRKMLGVNLRGEMRVMQDQSNSHPKVLDLPLLEKMKQCMNVSSHQEMELLRHSVYTPMMCSAAHEGNIEALKSLQQAGVVFTSYDYDSRTPLHIASSSGQLDTVKFLLQNGALVHVCDRYGNTPLEDAVKFDHHEVIKLLVKTGANLKLTPQKIGIELCLAVARGNVKRLTSFYLARANMDQGDYDNRRALHVAVAHGHVECVRKLLSFGVSVNVVDIFNNTPMDEAIRSNRTEIIELLSTNSEVTP